MLEQTYVCGNPNCGTTITFVPNEPQPIVCIRCGAMIDWDDFVITVGACPVCYREFNLNSNYCPFHIPPIPLLEKNHAGR